ncbi:MAG: HAD family acid phosphatase [Opitutaceae bacterium]|nr:HAD family acid phosphatase [Opitutaceae bacterium]
MALAGCATALREPANLFPHKQELKAYVESGAYRREIAAVAAQAQAWVEQRAKAGGVKLTVVFDLDETLLDNWPYLTAMDFGYVHREWDRWVEAANAPAHEPVREVFQVARRLGVEVVFLTGRPERARVATEKNLHAIGCGDFAVLICRPDDDRRSNAEFKTAVRARLAAGGRAIIANLGDQASDLAGGYAERTFKLPNPFYLSE